LTAGCTLLRVGERGAGKPSAQPDLVEEQSQLQRFAERERDRRDHDWHSASLSSREVQNIKRS